MPILIFGHGKRPLLGTGAHHIHAGHRLHNVSDSIVGKHLRYDLDDLCDDDVRWYAAVAFADGKVVFVPRSPFQPPLEADKAEKLMEVAILANRECHHQGHWVFAFAGGEMIGLWRDWDGDVQFEQTFNDTWERLKAAPPEWWVEILNRCWVEAQHRLADVGVHPDQKIMQARGEKPRGH